MDLGDARVQIGPGLPFGLDRHHRLHRGQPLEIPERDRAHHDFTGNRLYSEACPLGGGDVAGDPDEHGDGLGGRGLRLFLGRVSQAVHARGEPAVELVGYHVVAVAIRRLDRWPGDADVEAVPDCMTEPLCSVAPPCEKSLVATGRRQS